MTNLNKRIGQRIAQLRKNSCVTQKKLAELIDTTASTVSDIETGKSAPRFTMALKLCAALGVDLNYLAGTTESDAAKLFGAKGVDLDIWLKYSSLYVENKKKVADEIVFLQALDSRLKLVLDTHGIDPPPKE